MAVLASEGIITFYVAIKLRLLIFFMTFRALWFTVTRAVIWLSETYLFQLFSMLWEEVLRCFMVIQSFSCHQCLHKETHFTMDRGFNTVRHGCPGKVSVFTNFGEVSWKELLDFIWGKWQITSVGVNASEWHQDELIMTAENDWTHTWLKDKLSTEWRYKKTPTGKRNPSMHSSLTVLACSCPVNTPFPVMHRMHRHTAHSWQLEHKYVGCPKHFQAFQIDLLSPGLHWYEADSHWFNLYLFLLSSLMPPESESCLYGDRVVTLPSANAIWAPQGPECSTPPTNQSLMIPLNKRILTTLAADNFRCWEIVNGLSGRGTVTEYLCGDQGQCCNKGIRQPSLM